MDNLKEILEKHVHWLNADCDGWESMRATLREADLSGVNLSGTTLREANLSGANLSGANLSGANLFGAVFSGANLSGANLYGANLFGANLSGANLYGAIFSGANLSGADLSGADLYGADLLGANLYGANLYGANISIEILNESKPICCPEYGSFIGWKKAGNGHYIVKLEIQDNAKRTSAYGRECRCSSAKVLAIEKLDGSPTGITQVVSLYDNNFVYQLGKIVSVENFDEDRRNECSTGIHFFITRQEAVDYIL